MYDNNNNLDVTRTHKLDKNALQFIVSPIDSSTHRGQRHCLVVLLRHIKIIINIKMKNKGPRSIYLSSLYIAMQTYIAARQAKLSRIWRNCLNLTRCEKIR